MSHDHWHGGDCLRHLYALLSDDPSATSSIQVGVSLRISPRAGGSDLGNLAAWIADWPTGGQLRRRYHKQHYSKYYENTL
jgi:hypothetical protein